MIEKDEICKSQEEDLQLLNDKCVTMQMTINDFEQDMQSQSQTGSKVRELQIQLDKAQ